MRLRFWSDARRGLRSERGGVAVEFAIILPVFLLLVFGIVDFGHAWYMKTILQNSCREGARYATRYQTKMQRQPGAPQRFNPVHPELYFKHLASKWGFQFAASRCRRRR